MSDQTHVTSTTPLATAAAAEVTAPVVHGAVILSAVETAWREIRHRFTDVPDISVTVPPTAGVQDPTKCTALRTGRHFIRNGQPTMELRLIAGRGDIPAQIRDEAQRLQSTLERLITPAPQVDSPSQRAAAASPRATSLVPFLPAGL